MNKKAQTIKKKTFRNPRVKDYDDSTEEFNSELQHQIGQSRRQN